MGTEECDIAEIEMWTRTQDVDREKQEGGNIGVGCSGPRTITMAYVEL